ncbi:hypothetical protein ACHQM5_010376 [Ranunculus cassubicifolius]
MGSSQSTEVEQGEEVENEEEEEDDDNDNDNDDNEMERREFINPLMKKVLEQEPEMLPCHSSASPLSPQLSNFGTPRLGPSIKVWDPYNVLAPPPPLPPPPPHLAFSRSFSSDGGMEYEGTFMEVFLINHGDCGVNLRPDLVGGRWPEADLTTNGQRQARALAVFLNSQGVRFNAVYSSPLERARVTALSVCQELSYAEEQIQISNELVEMSQGQWEGCLIAETYTSDMVTLIDRLQPDFAAPSGESLRQVEFRMVQFLNNTVLGLPEKLRSENKGLSRENSQDGPISLPQRPGLSKKKSGKSRLQFVTTTGNQEDGDLHEGNVKRSSSISSIGVFTHAMPIKCVVMGLLGCSPAMAHKLCIDDSSVTVLQHSLRTGWQVRGLNETAHLRLL